MPLIYVNPPIEADSWNNGIPSIGRRDGGSKRKRARGLDNIHTMDTHFRSITSLYFLAFVACAFCGIVSLGPNPSTLVSASRHMFAVNLVDSVLDSPPILAQSPHLAAHVVDSHGHWFQCNSCNQAQTSSQVSYTQEYLNMLLRTPVHALQQLSVVNIGTLFADQLRGYSSGTMRRMSYISGAILSFNAADMYALTDSNIRDLVSIIASNIRTNPIMRRFETMFERFGEEFQQLTVISSERIGAMLRDQIDRSPIIRTGASSTYRFASLQPADITLSQLQPDRQYTLGTQYLRNELEPRDFTVNSVGVAALDDMESDYEEMFSTFEYAMFPFLFPMGLGFYGRRNNQRLGPYLKYRMSCLFSVFTLYPQYLLLMHQMHTAHRIVSNISETVISKELQRLRKLHPEMPEGELFALAAKHKLAPNVPGSPKYYRANLRHLLNQVESKGMPALFLTLTMDEVSDIKWSEVADAEQFLNSFTEGKSFRDMPVEMTKLFHQKVTDFMNEFILPTTFGDDEPGILGRVTGYMIRYELQMRGSPHAHIVLWIHPDDRARIASEIMAYVPASYNASTEAWIPPTDPRQRELFDLVLRKQEHPCSPPGCGCRANAQKRCKYGYPCACTDEPNHYSPRLRSWVYRRPFVPRTTSETSQGMNDRVVPYHPTVLLLWKAHMNLQVITNEAWSFYLLKYATKCEPSATLDIDEDLARSLGLHKGDAQQTPLDEVTLKFISGVALTRPVCPSEAALDILQIPVLQFDTKFTEVMSFPPSQRKSYSNGNPQPLLSSVDKYQGRMPAHSDLTFTAYFRQFDVLTKRAPSLSAHLVGQDIHRRFVYRRPSDVIVGFSDFNPMSGDGEAFFYNVLLKTVPFHDESSLISPGNVSKTYTEECRIRGHFRDEQDVIDLLADYSNFHLYSEDQCGKLLAKLLSKFPLDVEPNLDGVQIPDPPLPTSNTFSATDQINDEFQSLDDVLMNQDQQLAFDQIICSESGVHFLEGEPGCGKSFVTKKLIRHYDLSRTAMHINASTGAAASRLSKRATTVHTGFGLGASGTFLRLISPDSDVFASLYYSKVYIIDEFSMLTSFIANLMLYRLGQIHNSTDVLNILSCIKVIFIGDSLQLPAVCNHKVDSASVCSICRINQSTFWKHAIRHVLTTVVRHANDLQYLDFLKIIRVRKPTQEEIDTSLGDCFVNDIQVVELLRTNADIQVLTTHLDVAASYNNAILSESFPTEPLILVPIHARTTDANFEAVADWLVDPKFHTLPAVKLGCRVILLENLNLTVGACNGATGVVQSIHYRGHEADRILNKIVILLDTGTIVNVMRTRIDTQHVAAFRYYKTTFPLSLGRAMTGHRCQGATISSMLLLHITEAFCPGLLYVMLSRVTERRYLRIFDRLTPDDFNPVPPM